MQPSSSAPSLQWEFGTAYEFFVSLIVLHAPEKHGVRAAWAAGIRSRIPTPERKFLEEVLPFIGIPLCWVHHLPAPRDAVTLLLTLRQIPPEKRALALLCAEEDTGTADEEKNVVRKTLLGISQKGSWDEQDYQAVGPLLQWDWPPRDETQLRKYLDSMADPARFGEMLLAAFQAYYQAFFEEEEKRVAPILQAGLERAQTLAATLSLPDLLVELSQGVRLHTEGIEQFVIGPAYWTTPLILYEPIGTQRMILLFGARPADMAAIPGELVPDALLRSLRALSDPTRLKILHYLQQQALTPSALARRLRLRAPTVTHHLSELRLAGLVTLDVSGQEKYYTTRFEALEAALDQLKEFIRKPSRMGE